MSVNPVTFAARILRPRQGASDEHTLGGVCKERATPPGSQRTAARRVAPHLAWRFVARRSQPHWRGMLPPRASPHAKWGATNATGFTFMTPKQASANAADKGRPPVAGTTD